MARLICKFSVIKFIPSNIKQEVINIGIVIHSSKNCSLDVKFLDYDTRIKHFITDIQFAEFKAFKRLFSKYVRGSTNKLIDSMLQIPLEDESFLEKLQSSLNIPFVMSKTEYIFTENPSNELENLYNTLILDPEECRVKQKTLVKQVEERFMMAGLEQYLQRGISIKGLPFDFNIEFGVKVEDNVYDYVQPISLQESPRENFKEGVFWRETLNKLNHDPNINMSKFFAIIKPPKDPRRVGFSELIKQFQDLENTEIVNYNNSEFDRLIYNIKHFGKLLSTP